MRKTPLDDWIAARIGAPLTPENLARYQAAKLRETVAFAAANSPFYRERLAGIGPESVAGPADLARLPFTSPRDLHERGADMVCVSQGEIVRAVTLASSGTTGPPKRLFFTGAELEATVDFFHHGMSTFTRAGDKVLILMPGDRPGSVGDLLGTALTRLGAVGHLHDLSLSPDQTLDLIEAQGFSAMVCLPVQALVLARAAARRNRPRPLASVLVSADYAAAPLLREVEQSLCGRVYAHWGMTETGLGGAVECLAKAGCHLREADLYLEIVDPGSGDPLPDGATGEIVATTLTRTGMPLLRYRTGDLAQIVSAPCPCGSRLRRLTGFRGRTADVAPLRGGASVSMAELNEGLFSVPGLLDFTAVLRQDSGGQTLELAVRMEAGEADLAPVIRTARSLLTSKQSPARVHARAIPDDGPPLARLGKRMLAVMGDVPEI
jgi:phenylacetate-coenzyme A ligase PaaK-like adenylate-forming protein